ncbi:crossover junction endodeoxyribonuclease RuvC [bacterium]|mgnify:CR=1 FL=1|nr:crossover junction endodeoxyribonuclease RuvC [bacterium]
MIILGIDPGIAITGYAFVRCQGNQFSPICYGAIRTEANTPLASRLVIIEEKLQSLITEFKPDTCAIESLFFSKNVKTAMTVGQARGVLVLTAAKNGLDIAEYTPSNVKLAVCGYGGADKRQMQQMVKSLLKLTETPKPDDVADALGIAICHAHSHKVNSLK